MKIMKTFSEFIYECFLADEHITTKELIQEARGGPDYDYEQSFVNLYNHMVNKTDSEGADMRELFRGAVQRRDMFTITDLIAKEVERAQTDPSSPLNFDNLSPDDPGLTGGKRSKSTNEVEDKEAHRQAYYDKLLNQQYSLLNFVQSKSGRIQASKGHVAEREGATNVPLTAKAKEITGKEQDTSKVDVSFIDDSGNRYGISLKDAKGAVVNSSGAEETKAYILLGINTLLDQQEQSGEITPEQRAEKEAMSKELADQLSLYMASTRGMSKEQQKDALPQMQEYLNGIESVVPGAIQAMSSEAITGKGKYGDASTVDALFSTGRGGEVIEDPSWLAQYVFQRGRLGKGTTKTKAGAIQRPTTIAGDIKNYQDAEGKPKTSEYLKKWETDWGQPAWEKKIATFEPEIQDEIRRLQNNDDFGLDDLFNYETQDAEVKQLKAVESQAASNPEVQQYDQTAADLEQQATAAAAEVDAANKEADKASVVRFSNGKPVPRKNRYYLANNPDEAEKHNQTVAAANAAKETAQSNFDAVNTALQTHISSPPPTPEQPQQQPEPPPEQPQQQPAPQQPQQSSEPAPEQPQGASKRQKKQQPQPTQEPAPAQSQQPTSDQQQPAPEQQTAMRAKLDKKKKEQKLPVEVARKEYES